MNGTIKAILPIYRHTATSGAQVGMIVNTKKQIKYAILSGCNSEKSAHA
jgi:hypothetical protein